MIRVEHLGEAPPVARAFGCRVYSLHGASLRNPFCRWEAGLHVPSRSLAGDGCQAPSSFHAAPSDRGGGGMGGLERHPGEEALEMQAQVALVRGRGRCSCPLIPPS